MKAVLAIDQGTTGSTGLIIDESGRVRARAYSEFRQHYPRPGWVEHDADEIWRVTAMQAREALDAARREKLDVVGIGITNQRETTVVWDRASGKPLHRAIVWQDRRTTPRCRALKDEGREPWVRERTGLVLDPYFSGTKLEWILENVSLARRRAEAGELAFGTIDSWLIWKLTNGASHVTEPTNASRTLLYDIDRLGWSSELCDLFGVPMSVLPEVRPSSGEFGVADGAHIGAELPILGVAGDQQAALFGQGCVTPGLAKNTYGTGAFLLLNTGDKRVDSKNGLLTTVACDAAGRPAYALEGAIFIAGAAVQWLRDELGIVEDAAETESLARSLQSNDGVYLVPAFVGLGAPHWEAEARGMLVGLTRGSGRAHFARAALESMAYATYDVLHAMIEDSGLLATEFAVDGGATRNDWLVQFQADLIGVPVRRPQIIDTTAMGAAGLAGIAAGVWSDAHAFRSAIEEPDVFTPHVDRAERDALLKGWHRAVNAALAWARNEA
ncbi:MAG: glycerol kinase GlpK [Longimicrobiales bacterium]